MRDWLELPRLSKAERGQALVHHARADARARNRLSGALGLAGDVGFHHGQRTLSLPNRRQCGKQYADLSPWSAKPTSFVFMPTFVEYWKRAQDWVSDVRSRRGSCVRHGSRPIKGNGSGKGNDRHGWRRRPPRSRRLASLQQFLNR